MNKYTILFLIFLLPFSFFASDFSSNSNIKELIKPSHLKKGDTILILAPAGKIKDKEAILPGIKLAEKWGFKIIYGEHLYSQNNSFAGTDEERLSDLQKGLDNPKISAIWCARGGYGVVRIIDDLNFEKFKEHPKWIIGYSDITILHSKIHNLGYQTIHGQMPLTLDLELELQEESISTLYKSLFGKKLKYKIPAEENNKNGATEGVLVGGNLSILYSMLGSNTSLNTANKILFIEDVGEPLYHIDRMLISLKRAGYFKNCKGLIVGNFRLKKNENNPFGKTLEEIVLEAIEETNFPVVFNFPAGHIDDNHTLILGANIELKVTDKKSIISFE